VTYALAVAHPTDIAQDAPLYSTVARKMHRTLEPYHGLVYFAPEVAEEYGVLGIPDRQMGYFASRAAAMGPVPAEVVIATFFNFSSDLVRAAIPEAWNRATPAELLAARYRGMTAALRRLFGDELDSPEVAEAAELARAAAMVCPPQGRPLFAAHLSLPWPEPAHLVLWHGATLLREYRGDGHVACLVEQDVSGCEALVIHGAMGDVPSAVLQSSRARSDDEWAEAAERLVARGWLEPAGALTEVGRAERLALEARTDELAMVPWRHLGDERCARLRELVRPFSRTIVESGAFGVRPR
jgi:hypothetical protein